MIICKIDLSIDIDIYMGAIPTDDADALRASTEKLGKIDKKYYENL